METINRDSLFVTAKPTFVEWLRSVPELDLPNITLAEVDEEPTVFLVPSGYNEEDALKYFASFKPKLVSSFFHDWNMDESSWPDFEKQPFDHWFNLTYSSMIYDLVTLSGT